MWWTNIKGDYGSWRIKGGRGWWVCKRLNVGDAEDGRGGWFHPHTTEQKPSRDIINSWIFCVSHLTAGWRWKGPTKHGIPPQLQEEWKALRLLHHQSRALGHWTTRPHSPCGWVHRFKVMGEVCAKCTFKCAPLPERTPKPQQTHSFYIELKLLLISVCGNLHWSVKRRENSQSDFQ